MPAAAPSVLEPAKGRTLRSPAFLCSLIMAALIYVLLGLPSAHSNNCAFGCHSIPETAHLSRGVADLDAARHVLPAQSSAAPIDALPPSASGPALATLVIALVAAILASVPVAVAQVFHAAAEAVLGVGRWHRTVVLHI